MTQKKKVSLKAVKKENPEKNSSETDVFFEPHVVEEEVLDPPIKDENGMIFGFYHPEPKPKTKSSLTILILLILNIALLGFFMVFVWYVYAVGGNW